MKFIVGTYGTEGDARPFAALCCGLMDAGHEARLLADAARSAAHRRSECRLQRLVAIYAALLLQTAPSPA